MCSCTIFNNLNEKFLLFTIGSFISLEFPRRKASQNLGPYFLSRENFGRESEKPWGFSLKLKGVLSRRVLVYCEFMSTRSRIPIRVAPLISIFIHFLSSNWCFRIRVLFLSFIWSGIPLIHKNLCLSIPFVWL